MKITLKLFAMLREHLKDHQNGVAEVTLHDTATVQDVFAAFNIPENIPTIILINGVQKSAADSLHDGDTLSVFPPIAGG
jgi:molybdopterin converting factor small subunit